MTHNLVLARRLEQESDICPIWQQRKSEVEERFDTQRNYGTILASVKALAKSP